MSGAAAGVSPANSTKPIGGVSPAAGGSRSPLLDDSSELDLESLTGSPKRIGSDDLESIPAAAPPMATGSSSTGRPRSRQRGGGGSRAGSPLVTATAASGGLGSDAESVTGSSRRAGSVDSHGNGGGVDSSSDTRGYSGGRIYSLKLQSEIHIH